VRIRPAELGDSAAVAELLKELGYPRTPWFVRGKIVSLRNSPDDVVLIAELNRHPAGVAHMHVAELFHEEGRFARIMALVVARECRRRGVGRDLLAFLEETARRMGCGKIEITSAVHRSGAHAFYQRLGYAEAPKRFLKILV
jgi:GNAT superfamily N-acetyltransferase